MNLEEMQQAWKELNERVTRNEILHREEVKRILNTRRENSLEKMTRVEKMGLAMVLIVCIVFASAWIAQPGFHIVPGITGAILILYGLLAQIFSLNKLSKIRRETNLENQVRHILQYKSRYNRMLLIGYPLVALFFICFLCYYGTRSNILFMSLLLAACIIADYFTFHYTHDRVKEMMSANRELKQIEEEG
ncbi:MULTISPECIES: hypothetical protein [unclassified Bacteroides]|mgnify:FL=1|uniref:hypothetical protein n=1 Tax=unclassified Bacteroides TaxID=2646097 RepID=UPI00033D959D|nr:MULTISPECIES: hypothetical protein [unclassified Bacteroides]CDB09756.1 putative uncharacterized protein [Bacteroides sp. CAG:633]